MPKTEYTSNLVVAESAEALHERVVKKVSRRILPLLFVFYLIAYLDRANVVFAKLDMTAELGFSEGLFSFGAGVFFVGYLLLEIPGALIVERRGAMSNQRGRWICFLLVIPIFSSSCGRAGPPYSPQKALRTFRLPEGFRIELVAAEPQIVDPVAMAFDERGRIYVVEMGDYPISEEPLSRVKLLEDRDGDGKYEQSSVFVDGLHYAHGVMPWKKGIIVTCAPDILYYEDINQDGRADVRQVLLTGFAQVNPQLRVNAPTYGIDNWIYAAYPKFGKGERFQQFSDLGRPIHFPFHPEVPAVDIFAKGMDFRFKPDQLKLEAVSGNSEFGLAFDAQGNRFPSWNDKHVQHAVIENQYLSRNPYLAVPSSVQQISDHGAAAEIYPITDNSHLKEIRSTQNMSQLGHFTSACGQTIYTGGNFPKRYEGAYFICEPVSNLVHCDLLSARGATFIARRDREKVEFLASEDSWFMPVFTTVGPDGALYVVDFYRKIVEHPEWIRKEYANDRKLFYAGNDKGRIYRIVHSESQGRSQPKLNAATPAQLVQELANPNRWWRITAQRLLIARQASEVIPILAELVVNGPSSASRLHALWTIEGLNALSVPLVLDALRSPDAVVREHGMRLSERYLSDGMVINQLLQMTKDPDNRVQFQLACTLGQLPGTHSFEALRRIAVRHLGDSWFQIAVLSAAGQNPGQWLDSVLNGAEFAGAPAEGRAEFLRRITSIIGARQNETEVSRTIAAASHQISEERQRLIVLEGLAEGLKRGSKSRMKLSVSAQEKLLKLVESPAASVAAFNVATGIDLTNSPRLRSLMKRSTAVAVSRGESAGLRATAIRVLGLDPTRVTTSVLRELLVPQEPEEIQMAAARALVSLSDPKSTDVLLEKWPIYTGLVREIVLEGMFKQSQRLSALLAALETGKVKPWSLSRARRNQLLRSGDETVRKRAERLFAGITNERDSVIEKYRPAVLASGNVERGEEVFKEKCSRCHKIGGIEVGPDLLTITKWDKESLLANILDPSASIAPGFEEYVVETRDGSRITGVMVQDSETTVTLRRSRGEEDTILRSNLVSIRSATVSAMPEGIEDEISVEQMGDLLEYLKNLRDRQATQANPPGVHGHF